tara:strand:- start:270 stop:491 length:222 start_codon:yes stop_codon:yes gene_type:complete
LNHHTFHDDVLQEKHLAHVLVARAIYHDLDHTSLVVLLLLANLGNTMIEASCYWLEVYDRGAIVSSHELLHLC